jgi:hypothetical protein
VKAGFLRRQRGFEQASLLLAALAIAPLAITAACRSQAGQVNPEECQPVSGALRSDATADRIAGEYRLTLVAHDSGKQGRSVSGQLSLQPHQGELRRRIRPDGSLDSTVVYAAYGATDVNLQAVGAVEVGNTTSRDPTRPGVVVLERHTGSGGAPVSQITLRLGSDANRREIVRFDGGYTALYVRELSNDRFAGDWASGAGQSQVGGHFCATRVRR